MRRRGTAGPVCSVLAQQHGEAAYMLGAADWRDAASVAAGGVDKGGVLLERMAESRETGDAGPARHLHMHPGSCVVVERPTAQHRDAPFDDLVAENARARGVKLHRSSSYGAQTWAGTFCLLEEKTRVRSLGS